MELFWQHKIADLMANQGMTNVPSSVASALEKTTTEGDLGENAPPSVSTIARHMKKIRNGGLALYEQRHHFRWPEDLGPGKDQVPREYSAFAMECMGFYKSMFDVIPMIGLVQRFALVSSSVRKDDKKYNLQKRAIVAEQLWYADLVENIPYRQRPDTTMIAMEMALSFVGKEPKRLPKEFMMPMKDWNFFEYMPCFDADSMPFDLNEISLEE
jgi:hypothetical protein